MSNAKLRARASELILDISHKQLLLDDIQRQLDSIVYPVLTLPPEITSEIFVLCLPAERVWDVVNPQEAPLLLMHVCSAWRQIAISTAALWTTLDIDAEDIGPYFSDIVGTWLSRACQCPLSVKIAGSLSEIHDFDRFLETLRRYAGGMRSLELVITPHDFRMMDKNLLASPLLQTLAIRPIVHDQHLLDWGPIELFREVPMLREVLMEETPPAFIVLPWKQLTKFTGIFFTGPECSQALKLLSNAVECCFSIFSIFEHLGATAAVSHPQLESFTLFRSDIASSSEILGFLTLPALRTLEIIHPEPNTFDDDVFHSFLSRSAPPLKKLVIRGDVEIQVQSLSAVPSLTDLEIWHPRSEFVEGFFEPFGHNTTFLPRLQTLSFLKCRQVESYAALYEIVDMAAAPMTDRMSNRDGFAPLRSFRLVSENSQCHIPRSSAKELLPFQKLKADGMVIYIGTEGQSVI
ncbi:hypothetical protein FB451DRAFT_1548365 [Mycena latifolia]|nr:hypothetical protein FB451DRAFT_1548365 [Mycena latifolia]